MIDQIVLKSMCVDLRALNNTSVRRSVLVVDGDKLVIWGRKAF